MDGLSSWDLKLICLVILFGDCISKIAPIISKWILRRIVRSYYSRFYAENRNLSQLTGKNLLLLGHGRKLGRVRVVRGEFPDAIDSPLEELDLESHNCVSIDRDRSKGAHITCDITNIKVYNRFEKETFDVIAVFNSAESHDINENSELMPRLAQLLKPEGLLIIKNDRGPVNRANLAKLAKEINYCRSDYVEEDVSFDLKEGLTGLRRAGFYHWGVSVLQSVDTIAPLEMSAQFPVGVYQRRSRDEMEFYS